MLLNQVRREIGRVQRGKADSTAAQDFFQLAQALPLKVAPELAVEIVGAGDVFILEDGSEFKYYASGVGDIGTEPNYSGGEQEKEALINVIQLSKKGLAESSKEALRLDRHARIAAKKIFGNSEPAKRA